MTADRLHLKSVTVCEEDVKHIHIHLPIPSLQDLVNPIQVAVEIKYEPKGNGPDSKSTILISTISSSPMTLTKMTKTTVMMPSSSNMTTNTTIAPMHLSPKPVKSQAASLVRTESRALFEETSCGSRTCLPQKRRLNIESHQNIFKVATSHVSDKKESKAPRPPKVNEPQSCDCLQATGSSDIPMIDMDNLEAHRLLEKALELSEIFGSDFDDDFTQKEQKNVVERGDEKSLKKKKVDDSNVRKTIKPIKLQRQSLGRGKTMKYFTN